MPEVITSTHNARVKAVAKLQRHGRERRQRGRLCVETERELSRARAAGFHVAEFYHTPAWLTADPQRQARLDELDHGDAFVAAVSDAVLRKIAYRENPQGFVAVLTAKTTSLQDLLAGDAAAGLVVCSGLEKPGNVGAILRSAAAAGVAGLIIDQPRFDLFNPNCIRASTGAVFSLPIACVDRPEVIAALRAAGRTIYALSPEGAESYTRIDWRTNWAIVLGAEAEGLDPAWRDAADRLVSIPLASPPEGMAVDSLNVSVAAAIVMFHARREATMTRDDPGEREA